jgi:colicin import membrane protein
VKRVPETPAALEKRAQPGRVRAVILAIVVHALFFGFIIVGVTWQSSPTPPIEAEIWDKLPPVAAKAPPPPEPPPPEPPKPQPKPEPPKPEPPKPDVKPDPPKPDPEIALKAEREKREREKKKKDDEAKKKREDLEAARKKHELEEAAKKKRDQEEAARKKREEDIAKREAEKARAAQMEARQKEFNEYVAKIQAKIRSRANVPDSVTGKPNVQVQIKVLPGGDVLDIRVTKPSGNRAYDTAIERAIRSAVPLPVPPASSELFPQFRELILNIEHER